MHKVYKVCNYDIECTWRKNRVDENLQNYWHVSITQRILLSIESRWKIEIDINIAIFTMHITHACVCTSFLHSCIRSMSSAEREAYEWWETTMDFMQSILNRFAFMGFIWFLPKVSLCKRWLKSRGTMLKHAHSLSAFGSVPLFSFFSFFLFNYQCADRHYSSSKHLNRSTTKRQPR